LPGESGLEFTRRLKASRSAAPVVVLTSYDLPEYRREAKSCGADHYLVKGQCQHSEILSLVESIIP
jgi:DNA-binding NarL/FixJ family response regulator